MGLMQLLTVGRSLSEARDRPHRYKMRSQTWQGLVGRSGESELAVGEEAEVRAMKTSTSGVVGKAAETPVYPSGRCAWKVNPFRSAPSSKFAPGSSLQGELVLDNVKPKRNDLNDSDLELVAATQLRPGGGAVKIVATAVPPLMGRSVWQRVRALWRHGR
jgi:hypothetical protein